MSYRFRKGERAPVAVRRILLEELDGARVELVAAVDDARALHEVRKRLKRLRALLRLARDGLPDASRESLVLRDVGRLLAAHRESDALAGILRDQVGAGALDLRLLEETVRLHQAARAPLGKRSADLSRARRTLGGLRRRLAATAVEGLRPKDCRRRLRRAYRRACSQWWLAVSDPSDENLHEWRKLSKILLNHLRLLRVWAAPGLSRVRSALADLDERLGRARDCAHLAGILRGVPVAEFQLYHGQCLRFRLEQAVDDELSRSFALGRRVFRFEPREFERHVLR